MPLKQEYRWAARPRLAFAVKVAVYLLPAVACSVVSGVASRWLQRSYPSMPWLAAALLSLPLAIAVLVIGQRAMRRLLPLSLLLRLSLLFPDRVPSRLGIALRAASPKQLSRRAQSGDADDASIAAQVLTLVTTLTVHDRRTRGHSERVRAVTMLVADELEIIGSDRDKLEWAALLHDLGKIEVPAHILNKPGRPSADEWNILKQHPGAGPALAGSLQPWLGDWIHAMDQHHERFDGDGYPEGLAGESIATSGRIVAVADAFEVMTATRSYKKPMSTEDAREELVSCAGSHFDPVIVRAFMRVSVPELHRALGPASWLLSLPLSRPVSQAIQLGSAISGGSVPPALVGAVALALVATPDSAAADTAQEPPAVSSPADVGDVDRYREARPTPTDDTTDESPTDAASSGPTTEPEDDGGAVRPARPRDPSSTTSTPPSNPSLPTVPPPPSTTTPPLLDPVIGPPSESVSGIVSETLDEVSGIVDDTTNGVGEIVREVLPLLPGGQGNVLPL